MSRQAGTELSSEAHERIARATHERYRRNQSGRKPADDPAMAGWEELPDHLRESNRAQAADIPEKLRAIGCSLHKAGGGGRPVSFTEDEIELMSEMEHDRWVAERRADGWTLGEERDVVNKITPDLVSWEELPENVREWDREAVRGIPELVASAGLGIRRG